MGLFLQSGFGWNNLGRSQGIPKYPQLLGLTGNIGVTKGGFSRAQTLKVFEGIRAGAKRAPAWTGHPCNSRWDFLRRNSTFTQQRHFSSFCGEAAVQQLLWTHRMWNPGVVWVGRDLKLLPSHPCHVLMPVRKEIPHSGAEELGKPLESPHSISSSTG